MARMLVVSIVSILKSGARKLAGASSFAKGVVELAKKLGPILGPIVSFVGAVLKLGGQGLAWLTNNLWVLALLLTYWIMQEVRRRRRKE